MPNPNQAVIMVSTPIRGTGTQDPVQFTPRECVCTWSWGLQPASALIDWVSATEQPAIIPLSSITIEAGGHTFYGFTKTVVPKLGTDGISLLQEFVDNREYLQWDIVTAAFNMPDHKIVDGQFIRRYWHILPDDYESYTKSYTSDPYTAQQILDFLFDAPSVTIPWSRVYHDALDTPVFTLDFTNGTKLGAAITQISESLGLVFTLIGGPLNLFWTLKGVGDVPPFPPNSDNQRLGQAVSGNPTEVTIIGDRNKYQVLNCTLQPDWLPEWQNEFWDFAQFINDIYLHESTEGPIGGIAGGTPYSAVPGDDDGVIGYNLAQARAFTITVAQYAALRDARSGDGNLFRDYRRFQSRSRLQMPVKLYLDQLMFRAFCLPGNFFIRYPTGFRGGLLSLDLVAQAIVEVTHDPVSGQMTAITSAPPPSNHNGYAIVRGYQVASDGFKTLNPGYFDINNWISNQQLWQAANFQIDDSGEGDQFIIFDEPVIQSGNLINQINIDGTPQTYTDGTAAVGMNAAATVSAPPVQAALTFLGDKFGIVGGIGTKNDIQNVPGLNGEYVGYANGSLPVEMPYVDGLTATEKANEILDTLLNGQYLYAYGGYTVQGSNATQLSPVIDRVTLKVGVDGITEEVDFTTERSPNVVYAGGVAYVHPQPEREFDRRAQLDPLFPGQDDLRQQARQLQLTAALLKANPTTLHTLVNEFHLLMGLDSPPQTIMVQGNPDTSLAIGTPLYREADANAATAPDNSGSTLMMNPVFVGVTVMDNENAQSGVRVTQTGASNIIQARVKCDTALATGAQVGLPSDYSATDSMEVNPAVVVGTLVDDYSNLTGDQLGKVYLARVKVTGAGGGMNLASPMEYDMTQPYGGQVWVHVSDTNTAATAGTTDPDSGLTVKSSPGWYCSVKGGVPIVKGTDGDPDQYHIPQMPLPNPDDVDDALNYWVIFIPESQCFGA